MDEVVEWTLRDEAPEAERIWVGVVAREKISVPWAIQVPSVES